MALDEYKGKLKANLYEINQRVEYILEQVEAEPQKCFQEDERVLSIMEQTSSMLTNHDHVQRLQTELQSAKAARKSAERKLLTLQVKQDKFVDVTDSKLRAYTSAISEMRREKERHESQLRQIETAFGVKLGKAKSGCRVLALSRVDDSDPDRLFYIIIQPDGDKVKLKATPSVGDIADCQPNEDRPLSLCVRLIRERFVELACRRRALRDRLFHDKPSAARQPTADQENTEPNVNAVL